MTSLPSLLVFGPQTTWPDFEYLSELRAALLLEPRLKGLSSSVRELPMLWQSLLQHDSRLQAIPHGQILDKFQEWIDSGSFHVLTDNIPNIISMPLTIIIHIVQYSHYIDTNPRTSSHTQILEAIKNGGIQGFCVGLLSAIAVASMENEADLGTIGSVALRLAACIGAYVDLDSVLNSECVVLATRWKSQNGRDQVLDTLGGYQQAYVSAIRDRTDVNITTPRERVSSLTLDLANQGITVRPTGLVGRCHSSTNYETVQSVIRFCASRPDMTFSEIYRAPVPVRSNSDAQIFKIGQLHESALQCILIDVANWHLVMESALKSAGQNRQIVILFGLVDCIPSSMFKGSGLSVIKWKNEKLSIRPDPESDIRLEPQKPIPQPRSEHSVAVIGMACKFPGADSIEEFWDLLTAGQSMCQEMPAERFPTKGLRRSKNGKLKFWGNFVRDADAFDHRFFKKSSREAASIDPQQRMLLEIAYAAMESSGYFGDFMDAPKDIGVYLGVCSNDYNDNVASHDPTAFSSLGTLRAFLTGRISHWFNWTGPSVTYDTACSSSAVAIDAACKAIQSGECSQAVAGGVSLYTSPSFYQNLAAASFLSPSGPTKPFDASADGYCRGEGAGLVVLKKLSSALADGDNVVAVIAGSGVNQNQNSTYITVPHGPSQQDLYKKVVSQTHLEPDDVSYVEAHGTGTPVGDPIEFESIRNVFGGAQRDTLLSVASTKGNIGHLEGAAGIASLIKVCLMLQKKMIPVQANFRTLNPKITALANEKMEIPTTTRPWDLGFRAACVNNYGAAGSNAALIVHEAPTSASLAPDVSQRPSHCLSRYPVFISANSVQSLSAYCAALLAQMKRLSSSSVGNSIACMAFNLASKQNRALPFTFASTVSSLDELTEVLSAVVSDPSQLVTQVDSSRKKPVVLCFGGQVNDFVGLSRDIYEASSILRLHLDQCDKILRSSGRPSLYPGIFQTATIEDVVALHAMLFSIQYSTAKAWIDSGLHVDTIIGHSFGQLTGLCVAESLSLEDGLKLVCGRASLMQTHWGPESGSMISVEADINVVLKVMSSINDPGSRREVEVACYNGPSSHVLVGTSAAIDEVQESLSRSKIRFKRLNVTHGFHSQFTEPLLPGLVKLAENLVFNPPKITLETCSDGHSWSIPTPELIAEHTRTPVYFEQSVTRLSRRLGPCTWLEAGSSSSITGIVRRALDRNTSTGNSFLPTNLGPDPKSASLPDTIVALWQSGYAVQFWPFHSRQKCDYTHINLPPYQFEKTRHWLQWKDTVEETLPSQKFPSTVPTEPILLDFIRFRDQNQREGCFCVDPRSKEYGAYVEGHAVLAEPLCPAPLYVELASQAALNLFSRSASKADSPRCPSLEDLKIMAPLGMDLDRVVSLLLKRVDGADATWTFEFASHQRQDASENPAALLHATGKITLELESPRLNTWFSHYERLVDFKRFSELKDDVDSEALQGSMVYKVFAKVVTYAPYYKGVSRIFSKDRQTIGTVRLPRHNIAALEHTVTKPLAVDNFFQVAGLHVNSLNECGSGEVFVCTNVDVIRFSQKFKSSRSDSWAVYSNYSPIGEREVVNDIFVFDVHDMSLVFLGLGAHFAKVSIASLTKVLSRANNKTLPGIVPLTQGSPVARQVDAPDKSLITLAARTSKQSKAKRLRKRNPATSMRTSGIAGDVRKVLSKVAEIPPADIKDDATLDDLGIDSLMVMEVLSEVQTFFEIEIPNSDWQDLGTPKLLTQYLASRGCGSEPEQSSSDPNSSSSSDPGSSLSTATSNEMLTSTPATEPELLTEVESPSLPRSIKTASGPRRTELENGSPKHCFPAHTAVQKADVEKSAVLGNALQAFEDIRYNYDQYTRKTGFYDFWTQVYPSQAALVLAYTVEAFQKLGCDLSVVEAGELLPPIKHLPKHGLLVKQLYAILEDASLVSFDGTHVIRTSVSVDIVPSASKFEQILEGFPKHANEHKLLHVTGSKLAECLTGTADPLKLLFRDKANKELLSDVYAQGPMYEAITNMLGDFIASALAQPGEPGTFHILELGGGTGGTTKYIVDYLQKQCIPFTYTFTDISGSLVTAARKTFESRKNMEFMVVDIEKAPSEQNVGKYHVILSTNCIHATTNITLSATHIRQMLRPDGFVSVVEFTRNMFWFDLVFGLLDGWWLFKDGRKHVLADQWFWDSSFRAAGFKHVSWTDGTSEESRTLRIITAFQTKAEVSSLKPKRRPKQSYPLVQTVLWKQTSSCALMADVYLPAQDKVTEKPRPIALLIHGGGHVMFTRKEANPKQIDLLLDHGFLPVSVDYRFCPELNILDGPMTDVCDALRWARSQLPTMIFDCPGVQADGDKVVLVGWSTGGHLAMTTAFTAKKQGVRPPEAILAFYCPTDYESSWWQNPIYLSPAVQSADTPYDLLEGVENEPIAHYYPATNKNIPGMLMSLKDPRWRFVLHMNWHAQTLPLLLNGLPSKSSLQSSAESPSSFFSLPMPDLEKVRSISPFAQIVNGNYRTPTYLIHGTADDFIPWEHSQRTVDALLERGIESGIQVLEDVEHLFDTFSDKGWDEIQTAYRWLASQIF